MNRFDQDALLDRLAARGALDAALMSQLAAAIARFHGTAEPRTDHGGSRGMAWVIDGNGVGFKDEGAGILDPGLVEQYLSAANAELDQRRALLDRRRDSGFVRLCHGDLHLRNIVLIDGYPTLFDGIEFNDELACVDVLYDLAFLLMDLGRRSLPTHANAVLNGYFAYARDFEGLPLLPLFLSCRSAVRAKTSATAARLQADARRRTELEEMARDYLALAARLLHPPPPLLVAVGGFSGSGKSTLARSVAPSLGAIPGAIVIRSDEIRKELCGVQPTSRLGPRGYTDEVTARVYATLIERAATVLKSGHAAIVDAVFARPANRHAIERAARGAGIPFVGLWLDAPAPVLADRLSLRRLDASDADADVLRAQLGARVGDISWFSIDASRDKEDVRRKAEALIAARQRRTPTPA